ncbi:uncharacterized protein T551_03184 [Pneumocystis jirovecii RU7]|uniref:Required for respiratory growth protein 9, mitochondrial n=1 Tax=Pneumocystis jirovecii (strain RU7) TaxID=1408657 RepID=A0A0W4ZFQ0_PNEJ7|nr:uncharacterized protein T551_03184 [Pneumocystis jirovecii RU7]KTW27190.1 hypothetical protein T551_03184 [Pneumocystis jirovecii RU7]
MIRIDVFSIFKKNLFYKSKLLTSRKTISSEIKKKRKKWTLPLPSSLNEVQKVVLKKDSENNQKENNSFQQWKKQKIALKEKFPEGWNPLKKLSPDTMSQIKTLRQQDPAYTVPVLSNMFKVSPEAIRRILKSKWEPSPEEYADKLARWKKRKSRMRDIWMYQTSKNDKI